MSGQTGNKPLFSQHYLEHRLPDSGEWQEDVSVAFCRLESLYQQKKAILPTLNEAQTEAELIQPILEILGFSYRKFGLKPRPLRTALSYNGKSDNQAKN